DSSTKVEQCGRRQYVGRAETAALLPQRRHSDPNDITVTSDDSAGISPRDLPRMRGAAGDAPHAMALRFDDQQVGAMPKRRMRVIKPTRNHLAVANAHDTAVAGNTERRPAGRAEHRDVEIALPFGDRVEMEAVVTAPLRVGAKGFVPSDDTLFP